ncbi:MAG: hypothetical protein WBX01_04045 [Nitrososphaeraceae archaeon]
MNRAGLDQSTSTTSRAFELFSEGKTPLQVAITLNLKADEAIQYHQQYFMLLGCTEFTKLWLQIKDNPWPYVNLVRLVQNAGIGDDEVVELLKIASGYLPRIRLEYDRLREENNALEAKVNSWKAEISNVARMDQQFVDLNLKLENREDELKLSINELEAREKELQKTTTELEEHLSKLTGNNTDNTNLIPEIKQEDLVLTNGISAPQTDISINYHQNENETQAQAESV